MSEQEQIYENEMYEREGQMVSRVGGDVISLIVVVAIAIILMVFTGVLTGQTYQVTEDEINEINNSTIRGNIDSGIASTFETYELTGDYTQLLVLGLVIFIVMSLVLSLLVFTGGGTGGTQAPAGGVL